MKQKNLIWIFIIIAVAIIFFLMGFFLNKFLLYTPLLLSPAYDDEPIIIGGKRAWAVNPTTVNGHSCTGANLGFIETSKYGICYECTYQDGSNPNYRTPGYYWVITPCPSDPFPPTR